MNKRILLVFICVLGGLLAGSGFVRAQDVQVQRAENTVTIGGKRFYMHHVKAGETLYGISKAYHVTVEQIISYNPELKDSVLREKAVIGIPYVEVVEEKPIITEDPKPFEDPKPTEDPKPAEEIKPIEEVKPVEEPKPVKVLKPVEEHKPAVDTVPVVPNVPSVSPVSPDDEIGDGYVIHTVKKAEKTKNLVSAWNVSLEEFRQLNPSVGSRVFVGQKVLIPYVATSHVVQTVVDPKVDETTVDHPTDIAETVETDGQNPNTEDHLPPGQLLYSDEKPMDCYSSEVHADRQYHVALLVPLYLGEIDKLDASRDRAEKTKKTRAMKFLQFYEGFMMAVDSLTNYYGLQLDLTVMDVNENTSGAEAAVEKLRGQDVDLIIGPFFSKSFAVVQAFAASRNILVVNPLSERESVVADASNVLKLKPSMQAMVTQLGDLIRLRYPKSKVTLMTPADVKDTVMVQALDRMLATLVPPEVQLTNTEMLELIAKESSRRKMGKRVLSNLEVEGQIFSTKALEAHPDDVAVFENHYQHIVYSDNEINSYIDGLSAARENVLVAYGDDLVFATKILNNINKSAQKFPITLIGLPQWGNFENLLVQNLLNMNAIYFDDHFVDYNDSTVLCFVDDFRTKYQSEPMEYAYEGFDVGWYFLKALMEFGPHPEGCLPYYHLPLLHSNYYFNKSRWHDGLENRYWNVYQYDNHAVELKPLMIYTEKEE